MARRPTVFISYSHDSPEFCDLVVTFAELLARDGVRVLLDAYEVNPERGWPTWMEDCILDSSFVLVASSPLYAETIRNHDSWFGRGVKWEGRLIYNLLYQEQSDVAKCLTVFLPGIGEHRLPGLLSGQSRFRIEALAPENEGYVSLLRVLLNQPDVPRPKLGRLRVLDARNRKTFGSDEGWDATGRDALASLATTSAVDNDSQTRSERPHVPPGSTSFVHRSAIANLIQAEKLKAKGKYAAALRFANRALAFDGKMAYVYLLKGWLSLALERHTESRTALAQYINMRPDDPRGTAILAMSFIIAGEYTRAKEVLGAKIGEPNPPVLYRVMYGYTLQEAGESEEAVLALSPFLDGEWAALANETIVRAYHSKRQYVEAIAACQKMLSKPINQDDRGKFLHQLGQSFAFARALEEAEQALQEALALRPEHARTHYDLAAVLALSGDISLAVEHLELAIDLDPTLAASAMEDSDFTSIHGTPRFEELTIQP